MSAYDISKIPCPEIQESILDFYSTVNPNNYRHNPLAFYLTSPVNTAPVQSIQAFVSPGNQKKRTIQMIWTPRLLESEISDTIEWTCTSDRTAGMLETTCEVDETDGVFTNEQFLINDLAPICQDNPSYIASRIAAMLDGCVDRMETRLHTQIVALAGDFPAADSTGVSGGVKDIEVLTSTGAPSVEGIAELRYTLLQSYASRLYTFGNGRITKYFDKLGDGCCTDFGVDLGTFYGNSGIVHFNDNRMAGALGENHGFLGLVPGAAQLVYYNWYAGTGAIDDGAYKQMTVTHGPTGLPFDMTWKIDCGKLYIQVGLAFNVCAAPTNVFATGDPMSGYNGILQFDATQAA